MINYIGNGYARHKKIIIIIKKEHLSLVKNFQKDIIVVVIVFATLIIGGTIVRFAAP